MSVNIPYCTRMVYGLYSLKILTNPSKTGHPNVATTAPHSRGRSYHGGSTSSLGATGDFRRRFAESNTHGALGPSSVVVKRVGWFWPGQNGGKLLWSCVGNVFFFWEFGWRSHQLTCWCFFFLWFVLFCAMNINHHHPNWIHLGEAQFQAISVSWELDCYGFFCSQKGPNCLPIRNMAEMKKGLWWTVRFPGKMMQNLTWLDPANFSSKVQQLFGFWESQCQRSTLKQGDPSWQQAIFLALASTFESMIFRLFLF